MAFSCAAGSFSIRSRAGAMRDGELENRISIWERKGYRGFFSWTFRWNRRMIMCGIAGFFDAKADYGVAKEKWEEVLRGMNRSQKHRGPDEEGIYLRRHIGLAHVRLSIIDLSNGQQPMVKEAGGHEWAIVYNGEIYNMKQLRSELLEEGETFSTNSDTEVILTGYMRHGPDFVKRLNGIFAFAI